MQNLKLLLVDDEQIVIKDLINIIDWNANGFTIVATAHSGKSALKLFQTVQPDVIITDIIMPQMNGIDFIHEIRKINPTVYILILSSYGEFEYAKAALQEGVFDYLLKLEITPLSLTKKMNEIYMKLTSHKRQYKKATRLELQEYFNRTDTNTFTWTFHDSPDSQKFIFMILFSYTLIQSEFLSLPIEKPLESMLHNFESILNHLNVPADTILFQQNNTFILGINVKYFNTPTTIGITTFIKRLSSHQLMDDNDLLKSIYWSSPMTLSQFYKKYYSLLPLINWHLITNREQLICVSNMKSQNYSKSAEFKDFQLLAQLKSKEDKVQYIQSYSQNLFENCDFYSLKNTFGYVCEVAEISPTATLLYQSIADPNSFEEFLETGFQKWTSSLLKKPEPNYSTVITHAIQYISKHYMDFDLNLESISTSVGLSSGRLSVLFKKETNKTPNEWITNFRIENAIDLLLNSNYKIYEISEKVGYRSSQYFSQIFIQHTGKKPLDYRKNTTITYTLGELENETTI